MLGRLALRQRPASACLALGRDTPSFAGSGGERASEGRNIALQRSCLLSWGGTLETGTLLEPFQPLII